MRLERSLKMDNLNLDNISPELIEMLEGFAERLVDLATAAGQILEHITAEMQEPGADTETLKALACAVVHATDGFDAGESSGERLS